RVAKEKPFEGSGCLEITRSAYTGFGVRGIVCQTFPADGLRGKRIRFRAALRAEAGPLAPASASLWLRAVRPDLKPCPFVDMADRPVRTDAWAVREVVMDVSGDARSVEAGFILNARGKAWFDSAEIEVIGNSGPGNEPPRPAEGRALENLMALARLLGYVRYFHPSDEAATAD